MDITDTGVEVTEEDIGSLLTGMAQAFDAEYDTMTQEDLEAKWFFKYDPQKTLAWNMYQFTDLLDLYKRSCRKWEEKHNGSSCVVERVRDTYLMPKIKEFVEQVRNHEGP